MALSSVFYCNFSGGRALRAARATRPNSISAPARMRNGQKIHGVRSTDADHEARRYSVTHAVRTRNRGLGRNWCRHLQSISAARRNGSVALPI